MRRLAAALLLALVLVGCDTAPLGDPQAPNRTHEDEDSTYRDAQDLTNWCLNNGLCDKPDPFPLTTLNPGKPGKGGSW